jgi:hypothetical protein
MIKASQAKLGEANIKMANFYDDNGYLPFWWRLANGHCLDRFGNNARGCLENGFLPTVPRTVWTFRTLSKKSLT